jgi:hypothetical protein
VHVHVPMDPERSGLVPACTVRELPEFSMQSYAQPTVVVRGVHGQLLLSRQYSSREKLIRLEVPAEHENECRELVIEPTPTDYSSR